MKPNRKSTTSIHSSKEKSSSFNSSRSPPGSIVAHSSSIRGHYSDERVLESKGYKIFEKIGEGSYSKIYQAQYIDKRIDKNPTILACKIIREQNVSKQFVDKFLKRSAEIMSLVTHPNIIRVHSLLTRKRTYFIFMEYAPNGDLLELLRKSGAIREEHARVWFKQIVAGLKFLHENSIVHRDIKCENILFTETYNIKITDFDFARYSVDNEQRDILCSTYCGSPLYTAPEIIRGEPYDPKRADMWSLGVVLYVMLNHSMPFDDQNLKTLHQAQMSKHWSIRSSIKKVLSKDAQAFIGRLLEPNPKLRPTVKSVELDPWLAKSRQAQLNSKASASHAENGRRTQPSYSLKPISQHSQSDEESRFKIKIGKATSTLSVISKIEPAAPEKEDKVTVNAKAEQGETKLDTT